MDIEDRTGQRSSMKFHPDPDPDKVQQEARTSAETAKNPHQKWRQTLI